jgi:2'-5' RNA ligase
MRYIIALLAVFPSFFIKEAQEQFGAVSQGYLLSQSSLPHITLAQFSTDDQEIVSKIWSDVQTSTTSIPQPLFTGIGLSKKDKHLWGVSLLVKREPALVEIHRTIVALLEKHGLACISETGELYRPHLTLARIKEPKLLGFNDGLLEPAPFTIALGKSDENGQYLSTIFSQDERELDKQDFTQEDHAVES